MGRPKNAVIIVTTPPTWRPTHIHAVPDAIVGARFYSRRLKLADAITVAREFNRAHLPCNGPFAGEWALAVASLRQQTPRSTNAKSNAGYAANSTIQKHQ